MLWKRKEKFFLDGYSTPLELRVTATRAPSSDCTEIDSELGELGEEIARDQMAAFLCSSLEPFHPRSWWRERIAENPEAVTVLYETLCEAVNKRSA